MTTFRYLPGPALPLYHANKLAELETLPLIEINVIPDRVQASVWMCIKCWTVGANFLSFLDSWRIRICTRQSQLNLKA